MEVVIVNLGDADKESYLDKLEKTFDKMKLLEDGKAAGRVADIVDKWIQEEEYS